MTEKEFQNLPENEKHFMRFASKKPFIWLAEFRRCVSLSDIEAWNLTGDRLAFLALAVAQHQTKAAYIPSLEQSQNIVGADVDVRSKALIGCFKGALEDIRVAMVKLNRIIKELEKIS